MKLLILAQVLKNEEHLIQTGFQEPEVKFTGFLMMSAMKTNQEHCMALNPPICSKLSLRFLQTKELGAGGEELGKFSKLNS